MKPSTALAIVTYVDASRPAAVRRRLPEAIASLEQTGYAGPVSIVDDGSTCCHHQEYLDFLARSGRYRVIRRRSNGGISRAKNTCLRAIADLQAEVGFLAEDDILFSEGWDRAYLDAMQRSGIQHFSWYTPDDGNCPVACNGALVVRTTGLLGLLLTFTREVLDRVGGFAVLPHRYGYEHIQWTARIVRAGLAPFAADIPDSSRFVQRSTYPPSLDEADVRAGTEINRVPGYQVERLREALQE